MAIRTVLGRHKSERTEDEELKVLLEELEGLSDDERSVLRLMMEEESRSRGLESVKKFRLKDGTEIVDKGRTLYDLITEAEYSRPMVDVDEWLSSSYFMGGVGFKWPKWRDDLRELFTGGYHESIVTGAIGTGKSTFTEMCIARLIYEYSCLRNPQQTYDIMSGDKIYIVVMNVNMDLAQKVVFEGLVNKLERCPYFEKEFPFESTQKIIRFPNSLRVIPRSSMDTSVLGLNILGVVQSETNFQSEVNAKRAAHAQHASQARHGIETDIGKVYSELINRWKSRFGRATGKTPGMFIIDSSKRDQSDFTETEIAEVRDDPHVFVRDYAIWDTQPAGNFSKYKFRVFVGDEKVSSRIIGPDEEVVLEPGTNQQVIDVPENWRRQAETDLNSFLNEVAGIATISIDRLFGSMRGVQDAMKRWKASFESPFQSEVFVTDQKFQVDWSKLSEVIDGAWRLKKDAKAEHAVHFDIGVTRDRFGIAMGYLAGETLVERAIGGEKVVERAPIIVIRWCLAMQAPLDRDIELSMGRSLLWSAMSHGHRLRYGSCDQYQSVETLQKMRSRGIEDELVSVEGEEAYLMLRTAANEDRLVLPENSLLYDELRHLLWDKARGRVDHPPKKSKDLSDAVCGVVVRLTKLFLEEQVRPLVPGPVVGISSLYEEDEEDPELWVLGPGRKDKDGKQLEVSRPIEAHERQGTGGSTLSSNQAPKNPPQPRQKKRKFLMR